VTLLYLTDETNNRIQKRDADLVYISKIGSFGTGNDQFEYPKGICADDTYIYVGDAWASHRVHVRLKTDLSYMDEFGSEGSGNGQFGNYIEGICYDDNYLYVIDPGNYRIQIFNRSTYAYVAQFGQSGMGEGDFLYPRGIACDATYLYITDSGPDHNWVIKRLKAAPYTFISRQGAVGGVAGNGDGEFSQPDQIYADATYLYVADGSNNRIQKLLKSDLSFISKIGTIGSGNDQFNLPRGITGDDTYLYICDSNNDRI